MGAHREVRLVLVDDELVREITVWDRDSFDAWTEEASVDEMILFEFMRRYRKSKAVGIIEDFLINIRELKYAGSE